MVKVTDVKLNALTKKATVSLFADTKAEVSTAIEIIGMPEDYEIDSASTIITASGEFAFRKSDGTWNWV